MVADCYHVQFKVILLVQMVHTSQSPLYSEMPRCQLVRSHLVIGCPNTTDCVVPRTRTKFEESVFCVIGPCVCESLKTIDCTSTFKRLLKLHFLHVIRLCFIISPYSIAFGVILSLLFLFFCLFVRLMLSQCRMVRSA